MFYYLLTAGILYKQRSLSLLRGIRDIYASFGHCLMELSNSFCSPQVPQALLNHWAILHLSNPSNKAPPFLKRKRKKAPQSVCSFISPTVINRLHPPICILFNQAKEVGLRRQDPGVWLISMEMYAAHKQTRARLIRTVPLIHRQTSSAYQPRIIFSQFCKTNVFD